MEKRSTRSQKGLHEGHPNYSTLKGVFVRNHLKEKWDTGWKTTWLFCYVVLFTLFWKFTIQISLVHALCDGVMLRLRWAGWQEDGGRAESRGMISVLAWALEEKTCECWAGSEREGAVTLQKKEHLLFVSNAVQRTSVLQLMTSPLSSTAAPLQMVMYAFLQESVCVRQWPDPTARRQYSTHTTGQGLTI